MLADTLRQMRADGVRRALAFVTSIFSSYSGCRQYLEDIEQARAEVDGAPQIHKLRAFYNHPLFIEAQADEVRAALDGRPGADRFHRAQRSAARWPRPAIIKSSLQESCRLVAERVGVHDWRLVYQSRSGAPGQPWLEPDIADVLREMDAGRRVVVVPIGFVSDHMEVIYDLDTEAQAIARERGVDMVRAATVGVHPKFLQMIRELIEERFGLCQPRAIGQYPPESRCLRAGCCPAPARRVPLPSRYWLVEPLVDLALGEPRSRATCLHRFHAGACRPSSLSNAASIGVSSAGGASPFPIISVISPLMEARLWRACVQLQRLPGAGTLRESWSVRARA